MEGGDSRKSGRSESDVNGNGALKKLKQGMEYLPTGGESKSKPCTEFFSTAGCPFGEKCYFSHHIRDGINPISKSLLCSRYYSDYGCFENCPYAHGVEELCGPISYKKITSAKGLMAATKFERLLPGTSVYATTVRTSTNLEVARSSVKGMNTWLLNRMSGAKISISNHESDPTMLNIKLEGTLEEVDLATYFVRDQIACAGPSDKPSHHHQTAVQDYGCVENCPYAHGVEELCRPISYKKITSAMGLMAATKFERLLPGTSVYATTVRTSTNLEVARSSVKGMNTWLLNRMSRAKISISNHESDPTMLNIKLEGTLEEVDLATYFVWDQIACTGPSDKPSNHHQTAMQANPVA